MEDLALFADRDNVRKGTVGEDVFGIECSESFLSDYPEVSLFAVNFFLSVFLSDEYFFTYRETDLIIFRFSGLCEMEGVLKPHAAFGVKFPYSGKSCPLGKESAPLFEVLREASFPYHKTGFGLFTDS